jgi:hypothetical protein
MFEEVSAQAWTILAIGFLKTIAAIGIIAFLPSISVLAKVSLITGTLLFCAIGIAVAFKAINCMVLGGCNVFTWVIIGLVIVEIIFTLMGSIVIKTHLHRFQDIMNFKVSQPPPQTDKKKVATTTNDKHQT